MTTYHPDEIVFNGFEELRPESIHQQMGHLYFRPNNSVHCGVYGGQVYYNVIRPGFGPEWQWRFQLKILLPKNILNGKKVDRK